MLLFFFVSLVSLIDKASAFPAAATDAQSEDGPTVDLGYGLWKATLNARTHSSDSYYSFI